MRLLRSLVLGRAPHCVLALALALTVNLLWTEEALAQPDADIQASASLEPSDAIGLGEMAMFEVKIESSGRIRNLSEPTFKLENFRIVGGPFQSTNLRFINGVQSSGMTLSWQLQPTALGKARVHSIRLKTAGGDIQLEGDEVEVMEEPPPGRRGTNRLPSGGDPFSSFFGQDPFERLLQRRSQRRQQRSREQRAPEIELVAEIEPQNPWVGQQVLYTLYLYTETDVHAINPVELPEFKGFWAQKIPQPEKLQPEMVDRDGRPFGRVVLKQWALFPRRSGDFDIEPVVARMAAQFYDSSPFASLIPRTREVTRQSNGVRLAVRDLPEPPTGFQGMVGRVRIKAEFDKSHLTVGEATTLTVSVEGRGHLQGVSAPEIPELDGVEVFPPQQQSTEDLRGKDVYGTRTWNFVLVPQRPGEWILPPIEAPYFDPRAGEYRVATADALNLSASGPTRLTQESGATLELHPIRTSILPASRISDRAPTAWWFFVLPWALIIGLVMFRRTGPGGGSRLAKRHLLEQLELAGKEERPRDTAARVETAWRDYLHERWEIPQGAPSTQWAGLLVERGVAAEAAQALVTLADDVHYLRYAPKLSSVDEMQRELVERSRKLVRTLR